MNNFYLRSDLSLHYIKLLKYSNLISAVTLYAFLLGMQTNAVCAEIKPNAGYLLRDLTQPGSTADKSQEIQNIENRNDDTSKGSDAFDISRLVIDGNTLFSVDQLHSLINHMEGKTLSLEQLEKGIESITNFYRVSGYPLTRALIPEQVIEDGVVRVMVLEAVWGKVQVSNISEVLDRVIERKVDALKTGQPVKQDELDRVSLMLSDLPGIDPRFNLKSGQSTGDTDLEVLVQATKPVTVDWLLDNQGSKYTGRIRSSVNLQWNNPFKHGDVIGVNLFSTDESLTYKRISFEMPLAANGWQLGAAISDLNYRLGADLSTTLSFGSARQNSVWSKYQLQRSVAKNMSFTMQWDQMVLQDHQYEDLIKTDRSINVWAFTLNGDSSDAWLGGGRTMWNSSLNLGNLSFNDADTELFDDYSAKQKGDFQRINAGASRQHYLGSSTTLVLNSDVQWALKNLDSSQKFSLGGARSVRAYEAGAVSGDSGLMFSVELRQLLPEPPKGLNLKGQWFASVFVDAGRVKINQQPWDSGTNEYSLSGVGLGFYWQGPDNWRASLSMARPLKNVPDGLASSKRMSALFELAKGFR